MWAVSKYALVASAIALASNAPALEAQTALGKYTMKNPQGQLVTLTLESAGAGKVKGSLAGAGVTFVLNGQVVGDDAAGLMTSDAGSAYFEARRAGAQLKFILVEMGANGQPNYSAARELTFDSAVADAATGSGGVAGGAGGGATAGAAGGSGGAAAPASTQDQQAERFLMANAWCSFSYSGSSTYGGTSSGNTSTSRVVFAANGIVQRTSGGERTNSGSAGSVWGSNSSAESGRWKVENANLFVSADGAQWQMVRTEVTRNSNGSPILKADGIEYMVCR
jgi:hypothetical protein